MLVRRAKVDRVPALSSIARPDRRVARVEEWLKWRDRKLRVGDVAITERIALVADPLEGSDEVNPRLHLSGRQAIEAGQHRQRGQPLGGRRQLEDGEVAVPDAQRFHPLRSVAGEV